MGNPTDLTSPLPEAPPTPTARPPLEGILRPKPKGRLGRLAWKVVLLAGACAGLLWGGQHWYYPNDPSGGEITATATRAPLAVTVTERGELESSKTVEVRCEVEGIQNKIVTIVPEGTRVTKGQVAVTFDADQLNKSYAEQIVKVKQPEGKAKAARGDLEVAKNKAEDEIEKAKLALLLAELDYEKYIAKNGEYEADLADKEGALKLAKRDLQEAKEKLDSYRRLLKKGLIAPEQVRLKQADMEQKEYFVKRDAAKLEVVEKYTKKRQEAELKAKAEDAKRALARARSSGDASIAKAQSDLDAAEGTWKLEKSALDRIQKQLDCCQVRSPEDGILVYSRDRWWDDSSRIQQGATVHFR
jgi:HlyD family secretion protein